MFRRTCAIKPFKGGVLMFVYEEISKKWLKEIKKYKFKKPLDDGRPPETHWCINHETNEALYFIGWVSAMIIRGNGEHMYEFAYFYNGQCIEVRAYIYSDSNEEWNEKNRLFCNSKKSMPLEKDILEQKIKDAIIFFLSPECIKIKNKVALQYLKRAKEN